MTRDAYLRELAEKLQFMEEEPRRALLDFYAEMLDDRMEDGMDEASAVAAMESPAAIAERQKAEGAGADRKAPETDGILTSEAMKFSSLAGQLLRTFEDLDQSPLTPPPEKETPPAPPEKETPPVPPKKETPDVPDFSEAVSGIVHSAEEFIKTHAAQEPDEDYVKKTMVCPAARLRAVDLSCGEMPIQVGVCPGDDVTLVYYSADKDPYTAEEANGVLTLRKESRDRENSRFSFSMLGSIIRLGWSKPSPTVELLLPADALVDLQAQTSNASIRVSGPQALCGVRLKTSNGRIVLEQVSCMTLDAKTSNARVVLEGVKSRKSLQAQTSNGRIEAREAESGGELTLKTSNGRVTADGVKARVQLSLTTSNGGIEVNRLDAGALDIRTSNGNITGVLPGSQREWRIHSATSNGKNSLPREQPGVKPLYVHTSNGSVNLRFEGENG